MGRYTDEAVSEASPADVAPADIVWELTADPSTTLPMAKRGEFVLWIVAHNPSSAVADTERNARVVATLDVRISPT